MRCCIIIHRDAARSLHTVKGILSQDFDLFFLFVTINPFRHKSRIYLQNQRDRGADSISALSGLRIVVFVKIDNKNNSIVPGLN